MKKTEIPLQTPEAYRDAYSPLDRHAPALFLSELLLIAFVAVQAAVRIFGLNVSGAVHAWLALVLFWLPFFYLVGFVVVVTIDSAWKYAALAAWAVVGLAGTVALVLFGVGVY